MPVGYSEVLLVGGVRAVRGAPVTYDDGSIGWRPVPEPATSKPVKFWARFTPDDAKLFWVTLAGTGLANVVTVLVVALAVVFVRHAAVARGGQLSDGSVIHYVVVLATDAPLLAFGLWLRRRAPGRVLTSSHSP
jgi:hypothetical protein